MFTLDDLHATQAVIGRHMPSTPAYRWPLLGSRLGAPVVVKHENHTPIGAFKLRGGLTYMQRLTDRRDRVRGVISATRGNHGQSLAFAGAKFCVPVTILVPRGNSVEKNAAMRAFGAELIEHGADFEEARQEAARLAEECDLEPVPSFHRDLVLGVATYALELFASASDIDVLYVPIGQGSGISGCILVRDLLGLKTEIVGVQAKGAAAHALSFEAGRIVTTNGADTFADGMATRVPVEEAMEIIWRGASRVVTVDDEAIAEAMHAYWTDTHNLAEGAGAAGLAAAMSERARLQGKTVGLILSGGNVDIDLFAANVFGWTATSGAVVA